MSNCLFEGVKLAENADPGKCVYSGYGIGFDLRSEFELPDASVCKNVIIFGVDMSSSEHIDNKKKDILILGIGPAQGSDDTILEAKYLINFSRSNIKFCLSLNGSNSFLFVNALKIYQFKAKDSEMKKYLLCLGNVSGDFSANNMKKRIKWVCVRFLC